jgi:hypothetical protein
VTELGVAFLTSDGSLHYGSFNYDWKAGQPILYYCLGLSYRIK